MSVRCLVLNCIPQNWRRPITKRGNVHTINAPIIVSTVTEILIGMEFRTDLGEIYERRFNREAYYSVIGTRRRDLGRLNVKAYK